MAKTLTGRPRLGEEKNRSERLSLRVTKDVRAQITTRARQRGISVADLLNEAIVAYIGGRKK